jgi:hypothetical protein
MVQAPWPKLSAVFLFFFTFYFLAREPRVAHPHLHPVSRYHDLLANANSTALINHVGTSRLVRTLEGNEKRYQFTMVEREKLIEKWGGKHIPACVDISRPINLTLFFLKTLHPDSLPLTVWFGSCLRCFAA